jgi:hypothetical protein
MSFAVVFEVPLDEEGQSEILNLHQHFVFKIML